MSDNSDHNEKNSPQPNPNDWAAINSVTDMPQLSVPSRPRPNYAAPQGPPQSLPTIDMMPRKHRSYAGLLWIAVLAVLGGGAWYVFTQTDLLGQNTRPEIPFSAPTLQQSARAPGVASGQPVNHSKTIQVRSEPEGARVVINGLVVNGKTPVAASVPVTGELDVRVILDGHAPVQQTVKSPAGGVAVQLVPQQTPRTNLEVITEPPGAMVLVDGIEFGKSPAKLTSVPALGPTTVRLRLDGYRDHVVLTHLSEGEPKRLGIRLLPAGQGGQLSNAKLNIESNVRGAVISRVDDQGRMVVAGKTGISPLILKADRGTSVHLRAVAPGHEAYDRRVHIAPIDYTVQFNLSVKEVKKGKISIRGPRNLTVYLDERELDGVPVKGLEVDAGEHRIVIVDPKTRKRLKETIIVGADVEHQFEVKSNDTELFMVDANTLKPSSK
ncbi:MAG: PEGA domain-containing protein [Myxococcota bacterium]|nr:PEGA domain-containing protein [Myxococcota bacterium]